MKQAEIYKCTCCTAYLEVVLAEDCDCTPECCGKPMELMKEKTADSATEKHVPVIEKIDGGVKVKVGSVAHPMEEDHFIEWVEILADGKAYRQFLTPGQAPEAVFMVQAASVTAREHCNKHGLWEGK